MKKKINIAEIDKRQILFYEGFGEDDLPNISRVTSNVFYKYIGYFNPAVLFYELHKCIGNQLTFSHHLGNGKLIDVFQNHFKDAISKYWFLEDNGYENNTSKKKQKNKECIFLLKNGMLVNIDHNEASIHFKPNEEAGIRANKILEQLYLLANQYKKSSTNSIYILINSGSGLELTSVDLKPYNLSIETHYNDDLPHQDILTKLKEKKAGLFLFYGEPGTGKSSYIEYLLTKVKKTVIMLSPKIANALDDPNLIAILVQYPDSILVVEDAELLLSSRESNTSSSGISVLLSLTDGLLRSLNIQVIATFNMAILNIDQAVIRRGRCRMLYEFKKLSEDKTTQLLSDLKINHHIDEKSLTLAEIYNQSETFDIDIKKKASKTIGFRNQQIKI